MKRHNRRTWCVIASITMCALITVALTSSSARAHGLTRLTADGVGRATPPPGAPVNALAAGVTGFGYRLGKLTAEPSQNWVTSPLSIAYAFAMARAGASGETAAEIDRAFGFPPSGTDDAFNAMTRRLATTAGPAGGADSGGRPPTLLIGNALFAADGQRIGQPFLGTLAAQYGTGVYSVDFRSPTATQAINEWVRQQTADRIRKLFDRLDPATRLVLANAVYLRADWEHAFGDTPTVPAPFTSADGRSVQVPTMYQEADLRYASGAGWQAVELPYAHSDLAMWVMIPTGSLSPGDLLAPDAMAAVGGQLQPQYLGLALPRWDFGTKVDLKGPLGELGVRDAFDGARADFAGISPGVYVDQAIHRANIAVDERGTEAAAVTGLTMPVSARIPPDLVVRADRPFAFAVVHRPTNVPVFIGQVADPATHD